MSNLTRPTTVSGMLERVVGLLDAGEKAFDALARARGDESYLSGGRQVQDDLLALSAFLADHPELDADLVAAITPAGGVE